MTVIAHRGYHKEVPENTLEAFSRAIKLGADYIELDVRKSKDGHLVISHDSGLERSANLEKSIRELTLNELQKIDVGEGQKIPTLKEVLNLCKGRISVHVEIKEVGLCEQVANLVVEQSMKKDVIFSSFKHEEMLKIKEYLPDVPTAIVCPAEKYENSAIEEMYDAIIYKADLFKVQGIHMNILSTEGNIVKLAHEKGLWLNTYNVDSFILWEACQEMGVDGVFTNDAKGMIEFFQG